MAPPDYLLVPWGLADRGTLTDAEYCTYLVLLALAWRNDRRQTPPIRRRELAAMRGVALRTVDAHLHSLRAKGYVRNAPGRAGLTMVLIISALEDSGAEVGSGPVAEVPSAHEPAPAGPCDPHGGSRRGDLRAVGREKAAERRAVASCGEGDERLEQARASPKSSEELIAISRRLVRAGVYPPVAERLAREPWVSLGLVEAWIQALGRRPHVRRLGGLLAAILRTPESCLPSPSLAPPSPPAEGATDGEVASAARPPAPPLERGGGEEGLLLPWEQVLALLRRRLGEERVETWLKGSVPLGIAEGRLIIALRSPLGVDWVQKRYWRQIQEAIEEVSGRSWPLRFVVAASETGCSD